MKSRHEEEELTSCLARRSCYSDTVVLPSSADSLDSGDFYSELCAGPHLNITSCVK